MPFVKKTAIKNNAVSSDLHSIFVGRVVELNFFRENILKPEEPTHNIVVISGQGGVGKSTLLARYLEEVNSPDYKDYCLAAQVDERQATPATIMEKIATQLRQLEQPLTDFEKQLIKYKEAVKKVREEKETPGDTILRNTTDWAGTIIEEVPMVGGLLHKTTKTATDYYIKTKHEREDQEVALRLENPVKDLTTSFVQGLNQLAESPVNLPGQRQKRFRRLILFFDTFELLSATTTPWLLDYLLVENINSNIVLIISGRDSLERSGDDPKRWLPYLDSGIVYQIQLDSFTLEETRSYLTQRGIEDPAKVETIWHLSRGLPLYLGLLTSNPRGEIEPTKDVVANFLRWIPSSQENRRRLALEAALLTRPFDHDDLAAFTYLPHTEQAQISEWLCNLPFVRSDPQSGRYRYHELARELFSRHLYQLSKSNYYHTRRSLAAHYSWQLETFEKEQGKVVLGSAQWLELVLALVQQLLLLPDEASNLKAILHLIRTGKEIHGGQFEEVAHLLTELGQDRPDNQVSLAARQIARQMAFYALAKAEDPASLPMLNFVLEKLEAVVHAAPSNPDQVQKVQPFAELTNPASPQFKLLLATVKHRRGWVYYWQKHYDLALDEFNQVLELQPLYARGFSSRGAVYYELEHYDEAIADLNRSIELRQDFALAYFNRGLVYYKLRNVTQTIEDCSRAIELDPTNPLAYTCRASAYRLLKEYDKAIADYTKALERDPNLFIAYYYRAINYIRKAQYRLALADINRAIEIEPNNTWGYRRRGLVYLWLGEVEKAKADYITGFNLAPQRIGAGWMAELSEIKPDAHSELVKRLEQLAETDPEYYAAFVCRGVVLFLRKAYQESLDYYSEAITRDPSSWDSYLWQGMSLAYLDKSKEAVQSIQKALELGLPPVLLKPLIWTKHDRPVFYREYALPLLEANGYD
jgi:tetratricopeptide (TPR) repeat protein